MGESANALFLLLSDDWQKKPFLLLYESRTLNQRENPMLNTTTMAVRKFVQQISHSCSGTGRKLTVNDLRMSIRNECMSELSDWSNHDLDLVEALAALFINTTPLACVLNVPSEYDQTGYVPCVSSLHSPSPFAWT